MNDGQSDRQLVPWSPNNQNGPKGRGRAKKNRKRSKSAPRFQQPGSGLEVQPLWNTVAIPDRNGKVVSFKANPGTNSGQQSRTRPRNRSRSNSRSGMVETYVRGPSDVRPFRNRSQSMGRVQQTSIYGNPNNTWGNRASQSSFRGPYDGRAQVKSIYKGNPSVIDTSDSQPGQRKVINAPKGYYTNLMKTNGWMVLQAPFNNFEGGKKISYIVSVFAEPMDPNDQIRALWYNSKHPVKNLSDFIHLPCMSTSVDAPVRIFRGGSKLITNSEKNLSLYGKIGDSVTDRDVVQKLSLTLSKPSRKYQEGMKADWPHVESIAYLAHALLKEPVFYSLLALRNDDYIFMEVLGKRVAEITAGKKVPIFSILNKIPFSGNIDDVQINQELVQEWENVINGRGELTDKSVKADVVENTSARPTQDFILDKKDIHSKLFVPMGARGVSGVLNTDCSKLQCYEACGFIMNQDGKLVANCTYVRTSSLKVGILTAGHFDAEGMIAVFFNHSREQIDIGLKDAQRDADADFAFYPVLQGAMSTIKPLPLRTISESHGAIVSYTEPSIDHMVISATAFSLTCASVTPTWPGRSGSALIQDGAVTALAVGTLKTDQMRTVVWSYIHFRNGSAVFTKQQVGEIVNTSNAQSKLSRRRTMVLILLLVTLRMIHTLICPSVELEPKVTWFERVRAAFKIPCQAIDAYKHNDGTVEFYNFSNPQQCEPFIECNKYSYLITSDTQFYFNCSQGISTVPCSQWPEVKTTREKRNIREKRQVLKTAGQMSSLKTLLMEPKGCLYYAPSVQFQPMYSGAWMTPGVCASSVWNSNYTYSATWDNTCAKTNYLSTNCTCGTASCYEVYKPKMLEINNVPDFFTIAKRDTINQDLFILYYGCMKDEGEYGVKRSIYSNWFSSSDLVLWRCWDYCYGSGYSVSATQYSTSCFCSDTHTIAAAPESECNSKCGGNQSQICGGGFRNSVYYIREWFYSPPTTFIWNKTATLEIHPFRCQGNQIIPQFFKIYATQTCAVACKMAGYDYSSVRFNCTCHPGPNSIRLASRNCASDPCPALDKLCFGFYDVLPRINGSLQRIGLADLWYKAKLSPAVNDDTYKLNYVNLRIRLNKNNIYELTNYACSYGSVLQYNSISNDFTSLITFYPLVIKNNTNGTYTAYNIINNGIFLSANYCMSCINQVVECSEIDIIYIIDNSTYTFRINAIIRGLTGPTISSYKVTALKCFKSPQVSKEQAVKAVTVPNCVIYCAEVKVIPYALVTPTYCACVNPVRVEAPMQECYGPCLNSSDDICGTSNTMVLYAIENEVPGMIMPLLPTSTFYVLNGTYQPYPMFTGYIARYLGCFFRFAYGAEKYVDQLFSTVTDLQECSKSCSMYPYFSLTLDGCVCRVAVGVRAPERYCGCDGTTRLFNDLTFPLYQTTITFQEEVVANYFCPRPTIKTINTFNISSLEPNYNITVTDYGCYKTDILQDSSNYIKVKYMSTLTCIQHCAYQWNQYAASISADECTCFQSISGEKITEACPGVCKGSKEVNCGLSQSYTPKYYIRYFKVDKYRVFASTLSHVGNPYSSGNSVCVYDADLDPYNPSLASPYVTVSYAPTRNFTDCIQFCIQSGYMYSYTSGSSCNCANLALFQTDVSNDTCRTCCMRRDSCGIETCGGGRLFRTQYNLFSQDIYNNNPILIPSYTNTTIIIRKLGCTATTPSLLFDTLPSIEHCTNLCFLQRPPYYYAGLSGRKCGCFTKITLSSDDNCKDACLTSECGMNGFYSVYNINNSTLDYIPIDNQTNIITYTFIILINLYNITDLGCYEAFNINPNAVYLNVSSIPLTKHDCALQCQQNHYALAGIGPTSCTCSNTTSFRYPNKCLTPCKDYGLCGGKDLINIFKFNITKLNPFFNLTIIPDLENKINLTISQLGCLSPTIGESYSFAWLTIDSCGQYCYFRGFQYAGLSSTNSTCACLNKVENIRPIVNCLHYCSDSNDYPCGFQDNFWVINIHPSNETTEGDYHPKLDKTKGPEGNRNFTKFNGTVLTNATQGIHPYFMGPAGCYLSPLRLIQAPFDTFTLTPLNPETCASNCLSRGSQTFYILLQYPDQCYCLSALTGRLDDRFCPISCQTLAPALCGGNGTTSGYEVYRNDTLTTNSRQNSSPRYTSTTNVPIDAHTTPNGIILSQPHGLSTRVRCPPDFNSTVAASKTSLSVNNTGIFPDAIYNITNYEGCLDITTSFLTSSKVLITKRSITNYICSNCSTQLPLQSEKYKPPLNSGTPLTYLHQIQIDVDYVIWYRLIYSPIRRKGWYLVIFDERLIASCYDSLRNVTFDLLFLSDNHVITTEGLSMACPVAYMHMYQSKVATLPTINFDGQNYTCDFVSKALYAVFKCDNQVLYPKETTLSYNGYKFILPSVDPANIGVLSMPDRKYDWSTCRNETGNITGLFPVPYLGDARLRLEIIMYEYNDTHGTHFGLVYPDDRLKITIDDKTNISYIGYVDKAENYQIITRGMTDLDYKLEMTYCEDPSAYNIKPLVDGRLEISNGITGSEFKVRVKRSDDSRQFALFNNCTSPCIITPEAAADGSYSITIKVGNDGKEHAVKYIRNDCYHFIDNSVLESIVCQYPTASKVGLAIVVMAILSIAASVIVIAKCLFKPCAYCYRMNSSGYQPVSAHTAPMGLMIFMILMPVVTGELTIVKNGDDITAIISEELYEGNTFSGYYSDDERISQIHAEIQSSTCRYNIDVQYWFSDSIISVQPFEVTCCQRGSTPCIDGRNPNRGEYAVEFDDIYPCSGRAPPSLGFQCICCDSPPNWGCARINESSGNNWQFENYGIAVNLVEAKPSVKIRITIGTEVFNTTLTSDIGDLVLLDSGYIKFEPVIVNCLPTGHYVIYNNEMYRLDFPSLATSPPGTIGDVAGVDDSTPPKVRYFARLVTPMKPGYYEEVHYKVIYSGFKAFRNATQTGLYLPVGKMREHNCLLYLTYVKLSIRLESMNCFGQNIKGNIIFKKDFIRTNADYGLTNVSFAFDKPKCYACDYVFLVNVSIIATKKGRVPLICDGLICAMTAIYYDVGTTLQSIGASVTRMTGTYCVDIAGYKKCNNYEAPPPRSYITLDNIILNGTSRLGTTADFMQDFWSWISSRSWFYYLVAAVVIVIAVLVLLVIIKVALTYALKGKVVPTTLRLSGRIPPKLKAKLNGILKNSQTKRLLEDEKDLQKEKKIRVSFRLLKNTVKPKITRN